MTNPTIPDTLWETLQAPGSIDHRRAVVAAFALVACADGKATATEVSAFRSRVAKSQVFAKDPHEILLDDFDDLVARLLKNEPPAMDEVRARLRQANDPVGRKLALAAARLAVIADGEVADREEQVIALVAEMIGVDPATA
jgi:tellurite resistance protein